MKYGVMAYVVSKNEVVMLKKGIREGDPTSEFCTLPGGKLESFEKGLRHPSGRLEAVIRETQAETGIMIFHPRLIGTILFDNRERIFSNWKNPEDFLVYIYSATNFIGELQSSKEGVSCMVPLDKLGEIPCNIGDRKMYEWLKDGRAFSGVIKHRGDKLDEDGTWVDFF